MTANKLIQFRDLGLLDYQTAWDYQETIFQSIIDQKVLNRKHENEQAPEEPTANHLLLVEHPHVYTLGKSGKLNHLLIDQIQLQAVGAQFYKINRGGDITYHGPGQLVGYPILDLANFFLDIHRYLRSLEEVVILLMHDYNLKGERSPGETGVWLDVGKPFARKICAMGVRASRWVTMHGFALNVNPDMHYFQYIVPCGIQDKAVTSLQTELGKEISMQEVKAKFLHYFAQVFEATYEF